MKKLTVLLMAGVVAVCGVQSAFAAQTEEDAVAVSADAGFRTVSTLSIKQGKMTFYSYNLSYNTTANLRLENETKNTADSVYFKDFYNRSKTIGISSTDTYKPMMGCGAVSL